MCYHTYLSDGKLHNMLYSEALQKADKKSDIPPHITIEADNHFDKTNKRDKKILIYKVRQKW